MRKVWQSYFTWMCIFTLISTFKAESYFELGDVKFAILNFRFLIETFRRHSYTRQRHCTYNVTFRRVHATTVAVENQWVSHNLGVCICSLRCPACNAHAPYCHLRPAPLYNIFNHIFTQTAQFSKKKNLTEHEMCVLILSTAFVWNISHSKKK